MDTSLAFGPFCAFMSSVTWALGSTTYSRLSNRHTPFAINFSRAAVALPLFIFAEFAFRGWDGALGSLAGLTKENFAWFLISMVASYGIGDALFLLSTGFIGIPSALAIASAYPLWTAAAGFFLRGETLSLARGIGLMAIVGGVAIVLLSGSTFTRDREVRASNAIKGATLAIITSFFWALNTFSVSQGTQNTSPFLGNAVRMMFALPIAFGLTQLFARGRSFYISPRDLRPVAWIFIFEAFGGSAFFLYGLAHSPLAVGASLTSLAPILSIPFSIALGLEKFSVFKTLGIVIVVLGVTLLLS